MKSISSPISLAIMAYSDCQLSAVYGLADMLNTVSKQAQEQGLSIDQIAWQCGYQEPGAFCKVFGKIMGLTPGEYRRRFSTRQELT